MNTPQPVFWCFIRLGVHTKNHAKRIGRPDKLGCWRCFRAFVSFALAAYASLAVTNQLDIALNSSIPTMMGAAFCAVTFLVLFHQEYSRACKQALSYGVSMLDAGKNLGANTMLAVALFYYGLILPLYTWIATLLGGALFVTETFPGAHPWITLHVVLQIIVLAGTIAAAYWRVMRQYLR